MRRRLLLLVAFVTAGAACGSSNAFPCSSDEQCVQAAGPQGVCEPAGFCSFPDAECPSGRRFGDLAGDGLAGACVDEAGTDSGQTSSGTSPSTTSPSSTTAPTTTTTTTDPTATSTSTTTPVSDGSSGSTAAMTEGSGSSTSEVSSTGEPLLPDPVGWWALDDAMGSVATDQGTAMAHGALVGDPVWMPGHLDGALSLDGVDDHVDMGHSPAHQLQRFTLAAWVNPTQPSTNAHPSVVGKGNDYRLRMHAMTLRPSAIFEDAEANEANSFDSIVCSADDPLPAGEWHHIATTYDIDERVFRVWVDGAVECELTTTGGDGEVDVGTNALQIGRWGGDGGAFFHGLVDDVRLYDVALDSAQIQALASM